MFKALTAYHLPASCMPDAAQLAEHLAAATFAPCGPTQALSVGFAPPRGQEHGALVEWVGGHAILQLKYEQRLLPGSVVADKVAEMAKKLEADSGRKPGAKRRRELKDEALLELLPQAFTRQTSLRIWIAPKLELLVLESTSTGKLDAALSVLVKAVTGLAPEPLQTAESPAACMKAWLMDGVAPTGFGIGRQTELRSSDVQAATVRYSRHGLEGPDVQQHLVAGKEVRRLALNWKDRLDFVLNEKLQLLSIKADGGIFEADADAAQQDPFDADMMLATSELSELIPALLEGLGGRVDGLGAGTMAGTGAVEAEAEAETGTGPNTQTMPQSDQTSAPAPGSADDDLYGQAVALVLANKRPSISLIQRHLRIGYNRAACLLEEMEKKGVVSAMSSDGSRELLKAA